MIELKKITKRYGKNENEVFALKDVSLRIDKGEFVAIMGASGSGKSTLLHIIGAMDRATEGEYLLDAESEKRRLLLYFKTLPLWINTVHMKI